MFIIFSYIFSFKTHFILAFEELGQVEGLLEAIKTKRIFFSIIIYVLFHLMFLNFSFLL